MIRCSLLLPLLFAACSTASPRADQSLIQPPTRAESAAEVLPATPRTLPVPAAGPVEPVQSFPQVRALVTERNPRLKEMQHRLRSAHALTRQASLRPNPEIELEVEDYGGSLSGGEESESSLVLSQKFELGGKRKARTALGRAQNRILAAEQAIDRRKLFHRALTNYIEVASLQRVVGAQMEFLQAVEGTAKMAARKVDAGAALPLESAKAQMEVTDARLSLARYREQLETAKGSLASYWGGTADEVGDLEPLAIGQWAEHAKLRAAAERSPLLLLHDLREKEARRELQIQRAHAIPDLTLKGGYRRLEGTDDNTFVGALSLPLPIFDSNEENIRSARQNLLAQAAARRSAAMRIAAKEQRLRKQLELLGRERETIEKHLLPQAVQALADGVQAYERGRIDFLVLSDIRSHLNSLRKRAAELELELTTTLVSLAEIRGIELPPDSAAGSPTN